MRQTINKYMNYTLAKDTDHEFEIDLPFLTKKELNAARSQYKRKMFPLRSKQSPCWEFYMQFLSDDIKKLGIEYIKPCKDRGLEFLIRKYGEDEGKRRYNNRLEKDRKKNTLEGFIERYGEIDGKLKYSEKNKKLSVSNKALKRNGFSKNEIEVIRKSHSKGSSSVSRDAMIKRYGKSIGVKKYNEYITDTLRSPRLIKYWLDCGYDEDDAIRKVKEFQTRNLSTFIDKYGVDEGIKRYKQWNKSKNKKIRVSKSSLKFFIPIYKKLRREYGFKRSDIMWGIQGSKEFHLYNDSTHRGYYYDFTINPLDIIIEFNGSHVHPNPDNDITDWIAWRHVYTKEIADIVYRRDVDKIRCAESKNYTLYTVWDTDGINPIDFFNKFIKVKLKPK